MSDLDEIPVTLIDGRETTFGEWSGKVRLVVNVASRCGYTPQYERLEKLQHRYGDRGFTVLGVPSNQFLQEFGSEEKIAEYCSATWGVTFPMTAKAKLNGKQQHPLYAALSSAEDEDGKAGKVKWNFEKFLVLPDGAVHRFRSSTEPDDPGITALIEKALPGDAG
ncbi:MULTISPECIES: glutathione peroxidase [Nocardiopsis]|uniref:Glutathione peroxidase n=1 Tax=Nocardiopsis dassonvillei (strain ATCC 23218 / DSM 43111 / CIP 107115 / JCM 7437 / KCTC 9190 / NBRC 14626 / NCTC 10488 / NRRL B-5397 / IMRU 509) TaxID=446468 RepID=D7B7J7_NOCDD|nr:MULTISPECIES: glutathione peroxidase [Nocardiopsis]ADH69392.1 Peroxiredoxin [Nocardiopsis dassonvillei subsp. dassonvillei DSM 43111]APC37407.1 glutathione peroxidase [Nocardiopsis dassonvillei]NKY81662.1 glutathione peroxidase [Nocardiopsis dassonvillei]VEI89902.1 Glutathione peroxidase homolog BsaA [Nocardiopsis dassonvillei]